jgi:hypothetical protein
LSINIIGVIQKFEKKLRDMARQGKSNAEIQKVVEEENAKLQREIDGLENQKKLNDACIDTEVVMKEANEWEAELEAKQQQAANNRRKNELQNHHQA